MDMFGGQSHPNFDNDMARYVGLTREEERQELAELGITDENEIEKRVLKRVDRATQAIICNLNTMHSRAGSQVPFSSVNLGIPTGTEEEKRDSAIFCESFLKAYMNGMGNGEACIFPNITFRLKEGVNKRPEDPYYYLFQVACESASKRMNPTFLNIDASFNIKHYEAGNIPAIMG